MAKDVWDELADQTPPEEERGVSPDIARKLLNMNPAMRERGMNTAALVEQSKGQAKPGAPSPGMAQAPISDGNSIITTVKKLKDGVNQSEKHMKEQIAQAEAAFQKAKTATLGDIIAWLEKHDPELRSPFTLQVLESEKAFFERIGFSVKAYVEKRKKK